MKESRQPEGDYKCDQDRKRIAIQQRSGDSLDFAPVHSVRLVSEVWLDRAKLNRSSRKDTQARRGGMYGGAPGSGARVFPQERALGGLRQP
jgi:hypothetical protein